MSKLTISELSASVSGIPVLQDISLEVSGGEVHAIMGPNGSGKSTLAHILVGRPGYEITGGSVELDDVALNELSPQARTAAGLFFTQQYPVEIPGVTMIEMMNASFLALGKPHEGMQETLKREAQAIGMDQVLLAREGINVDLSGGESKRSEALQLAVLQPKIAVLDELDSGLDLDAISDIGKRIYKSVKEENLGVLAITHYPRLLDELPAEHVHVLIDGRIVESGGPELALDLENRGYARFEAPKDTSVEIRLN